MIVVRNLAVITLSETTELGFVCTGVVILCNRVDLATATHAMSVDWVISPDHQFKLFGSGILRGHYFKNII